MREINVNFYFKRQDEVDYTIIYHSHKCYEMVYYFSGKGFCFIDGERFDYGPDTFVMIPPGASHNDVHTERCNLLCIGFSLSRDTAEIKKGVYADPDERIKVYLGLISSEFEDRKSDFVPAINSLLSNIIIEAQRKENSAPSGRSHGNTLDQAISYIDEYFLTDISSEQLAALTNYSYHRFRHMFKSAIGVSPKQYILGKRFEYAKKLLAEGESSVTEIAYQCGFSSTSFFIKQFGKNVGITPSKYREQLRSSKASDNIFSDGQSVYGDR